MKQFTEGQWVKWRSTSNGASFQKVGQVVVIVTSGIRVAEGNGKMIHFRDLQEHFVSRLGGGGPRLETSYLVAVPQRGKAKPRLYWPHVAYLEPASDADHKNLPDVQVP